MRKYLVVDDNQAFAENLAEILTDAGAEVEIASGGPDALERIRTTRYDALISDMRMPVMGGAELVHLVRRLDPQLPAIVVTAYTNDNDLLAARHEGLLAVLPKPVPVAQLVRLVTRARRDGLVVVVDDDLAFADVLGEILSEQGFSALSASSLLECSRLGPVRPFAALVDMCLPDGPDGSAMGDLLRQFPGLPMVVVTGHTEIPIPQPPEAVFHKPFAVDALLAVVERLYTAHHG